MNSQVNALLHITRGILKDVHVTYPELKGLDRDIQRLTLNSQTRGLGLFTLDLPSLDQLLLAGLRDGRLVLEGPLSKAYSKKIRVPRLFAGLWLRVFEKDSSLKPEPDTNAIFFLRQLCCLGKKIHGDCSKPRLHAAVEDFHNVERSIRPPTLKWEDDDLDPDGRLHSVHLCDSVDSDLPLFPAVSGRREEQGRILRRVQQVADLVVGSFPFFEPVTYSGRLYEEGRGTGFRHGPGAVARRPKSKYKFDFFSWPKKLEEWFPMNECLGTTLRLGDTLISRHELPSRLIAVPKTRKGPRLIAAEPLEHMYCQQLILTYFEEQFRNHFRGFFINLRDQKRSGNMSLASSFDGSLATIDLKSASDRLSCHVVERMFRKNPSLLHAMHACRTRYLRDDISKNASFLKLKKFATQGTAVTFPVQSLVFLCVALGCVIKGDVTWDKIWRLRHKVRVFGDDIIVPSTGYVATMETLETLGLKVNADKSFGTGLFRESCGSDCYGGDDVTPVKPVHVVADGPASTQAIIDTVNNLFNKGLWNASESLRLLLPKWVRDNTRITGRDAGPLGFASHVGGDESHLKRRWDSSLHRWCVRVWRTKVPPLSQPRGERDNGLLEFFSRGYNPWYPRVGASTIVARNKAKKASLLWEPSCY